MKKGQPGHTRTNPAWGAGWIPAPQGGGTGDTPKQASPSFYLCQFDLKEKRSFFGQRKDYWDFLCQGLARRRQEHEGIRFVTSLDKVGGRAGRVPGRLCTHKRTHFCSSVGAHALTYGRTLTGPPRIRPLALQRIFSLLVSSLPLSPGPGDPLPPCKGWGCRLVWQCWITPSPRS